MLTNRITGIFAIVLCMAAFFPLTSLKVSAQTSPAARQAFRTAGITLLDQPGNAPDFNLPLLSGENRSLSSYRGRVIMLNFWATWCPPCVQEMPSMENLYRRFKDQGLEILAVNVGENQSTVQNFINRYRFTYPIPMDRNSRISRQYGLRYFPTTYIIDRSGQVISMTVGFKQWDTPQMISAFEALLSSR